MELMPFVGPPYFAFIVLYWLAVAAVTALKIKGVCTVFERDLHQEPICQNQKTVWIQVTQGKIR
jgi:hypothetical protein